MYMDLCLIGIRGNLAINGLFVWKRDMIDYIIAWDFNANISQKERRGGILVRDPFGEQIEELISYWNIVDTHKMGVFT